LKVSQYFCEIVDQILNRMSKLVFITGATSGFGKSIAYKFAASRYNLIITGRRADRLKEIKAELQEKYGIDVHTLVFDIRDRVAVLESIQGIAELLPHIDILVNNAGLAAGLSTIDEGDIDNWERMIDTNIKGLLYVSRAIIPYFKAKCSGHIINIGSTAGKLAYKNGNVYCATKFAVDALSQSMRIDLLPYSIKVTSVNPGIAETEFSLVRFNGDEERAAKVYEGVNALQAEDIADTVFYCATLPAHVCINDVTLTCLTQANGFYNIKESERLKP
jgi:3-hydroxy acid dehydrogenase/malonic semialdehyde reductase